MNIILYNSMYSWIASISLFVILLVIAIQDFKKMEVSLFLFPLGFLIISIVSIYQNGIELYLLNFLYTNLFIVFLFVTVWIWFSIKNRAFIKITDNLIGWGDILFFIMIAPAFKIDGFIFFLTASFMLALGYAMYVFFKKKIFRKIPLAAIMAIFFIGIQMYYLKTL